MDMIIIGIIIVCTFMAREIVELMYSDNVIVEEEYIDDTNK